jgi:hypothetical protein
LALLILLPLTMYFAQHDHVGQSVRFLALGLAWATSTVALFATIAAREIEPRLVVAGWWWLDLLAGRLFALIMLALALAAGYMALIVLNRPIDNDAAVGLDLVVTAVIAVLLGALFGVAAPRELDGVLVLFIVSSLQFIADPPTALAQLLPFWSTRELATYAIDGADAGSLDEGLRHAGITAAGLGTATIILTRIRLAGPSGRSRQHRPARGRSSGRLC